MAIPSNDGVVRYFTTITPIELVAAVDLVIALLKESSSSSETGLGILFGIVAALTGAIDLTAKWLLRADVLVGFPGVNGLLAERWMGRVHAAAESGGSNEVERLVRAPPAVALLMVMVVARWRPSSSWW